jgi:nicotinamide-nucleotide adenylyltransferase
MIHGRFQPFHNGHMAYLRLAAARCDELWVGITSPDRDHLRPEPEDPARHLPESNPFGYAERLLMVEGAAAEAGVGRVRVIPFPVGEPRLWDDYLPRGAVHYLRLLSPWGGAKLARLLERGERVEELPAPEGKLVSGASVRAALREGGDWRALVPAAVAAVIDDLPPDAAAPRRPS